MHRGASPPPAPLWPLRIRIGDEEEDGRDMEVEEAKKRPKRKPDSPPTEEPEPAAKKRTPSPEPGVEAAPAQFRQLPAP